MVRSCSAAVLAAWLVTVAAAAQSTPALAGLEQGVGRVSNPITLPDAPSAIKSHLLGAGNQQLQIHEILAGDPYRPLTARQKWDHFLHRTTSSATFLGDAEDTVFTWATGGLMYCCGLGAWGEQYAASYADGESRMFFGNFLLPTLLKQDPRYFPRRKGSTANRVWYAATRVFVTRSDSDHKMFNFSEVGGVALSKALSNAYYPDRDRGGWATTENILGKFQSDISSNELREFWPDIRRTVRRHTPKRWLKWEERLPLPSYSSQY